MAGAQMRLEYLARVVARAFYEDHTCIVMDALVRERYLEDTAAGMGAHLCLQLKQVRLIINELKADHLICEQDVDGVKFYYIDHQHFYDVVNYKIYLIRTMLRKRETSAIENQKFRCKNCGKEYSSLDIQGNLNKNMQHVCNFCGGTDTLEGIDNTEELKEAKMLQEKFNMQMRRTEQNNWLIHDGISDLLGMCCMLFSHTHTSETQVHCLYCFSFEGEIDRDKLTNNLPSMNLEQNIGGEVRNQEATILAGSGSQGAMASMRETQHGGDAHVDLAATGIAQGQKDMKQSGLFQKNEWGQKIAVGTECCCYETILCAEFFNALQPLLLYVCVGGHGGYG